jgi:hypothetical protein
MELPMKPNELKLDETHRQTLGQYRRRETHALLGLAAAGLLLTLCMWLNGADGGEKREMLSRHETVAQFEGIEFRQCMFRTALCPDRCGHSGNLATLRILKYLAYEKPGQYGDPQQTRYMFMVEDNRKNLKVSKALKETVDGLKQGDYVRLNWQHDYVTKDGSKFPDRVVQKLEKITRDEADKLTGGLDKIPEAPKPKAKTGPRPALR